MGFKKWDTCWTLTAGLEVMFGWWKYLPCQAKCPVSKLIKHQKHSDISNVLNNVLIIFCKLGFKGFCKDFKNATIAVLERLELKIFFAAQPRQLLFKKHTDLHFPLISTPVQYVWPHEIDKKKYKNKLKFSQKRAKHCLYPKLSFALIKMKRITFFSQNKKKLCKKEMYLNWITSTNRTVITKIRLSSKWYNLQEDMEICKNCEKKEIENEILIHKGGRNCWVHA